MFVSFQRIIQRIDKSDEMSRNRGVGNESTRRQKRQFCKCKTSETHYLQGEPVPGTRKASGMQSTRWQMQMPR